MEWGWPLWPGDVMAVTVWLVSGDNWGKLSPVGDIIRSVSCERKSWNCQRMFQRYCVWIAPMDLCCVDWNWTEAEDHCKLIAPIGQDKVTNALQIGSNHSQRNCCRGPQVKSTHLWIQLTCTWISLTCKTRRQLVNHNFGSTHLLKQAAEKLQIGSTHLLTQRCKQRACR